MSRIINHIGSFFPKLQKDFKIYDGEVFSDVYNGDFFEDIPFNKYINFNIKIPLDNAVYIRDFGAVPNSEINNAHSINSAISYCHDNGGGIVFVDNGHYTSGTIYMKSNVVLYIEKNSSIIASHNSDDYTVKYVKYENRRDISSYSNYSSR